MKGKYTVSQGKEDEKRVVDGIITFKFNGDKKQR